jgi:hypothetical protein
MAKRNLEGEEMKETIAKALGGRQSQTSIAESLGESQSIISRLANREDVKALIEVETLKLLDAVPQAVENLKALV